MRHRREIVDTLSLSFTDLLTCVLGAAIALFLIFVAIVKLGAIEAAGLGAEPGPWSARLRSIQQETDRGFATASVRLVSTEREAVECLRLEGTSALTYELGPDGGQSYFGRLYRLANGLEGRQRFTFTRRPPAGAEVYLQLTVGGLPQAFRIAYKPQDGEPGDTAFELGPEVEGYVRFLRVDAARLGET